MRVRITLTFEHENDLRRAMDEILDAAVRVENMARTLERRYRGRGPSHYGEAAKSERLAEAKRQTAEMLNQIADALDRAKVEV